MLFTSNKFNEFTKTHVLKWEGKTSKDPADTAVKCAPFPGAFHTNKGVTFCTFKTLAAKLGIFPVTYEKFTKLTDDEVKKFVFEFMQSVKADQLKDSIALALTEATWGSGKLAVRQFYQALNNLNYRLPVRDFLTSQVINIANNISEKMLFDEYTRIRENFLYNTLGNNPKYSKFVRGWRNRMNDFKKNFSPKRNFFSFFF